MRAIRFLGRLHQTLCPRSAYQRLTFRRSFASSAHLKYKAWKRSQGGGALSLRQTGEGLLEKYPKWESIPSNTFGVSKRCRQLLGNLELVPTIDWAKVIVWEAIRTMALAWSARGFLEHRRGDLPNTKHSSCKEHIHNTHQREQNKDFYKHIDSDEIFASVQYTIAEEALRQPEFYQVGTYMLNIAVELENPDAAIRAVQMERDPKIIAPQRAWAVLKTLAETGEDWRAMVLYALKLVERETSPAIRRQAYKLSQDAFKMTMPNIEANEDARDIQMSTWEPLRSFAVDAIARQRDPVDHGIKSAALQAGAYDYEDPQACLELARDESQTTLFGEEWVKLMTKAAMAGLPHSESYTKEYIPNAAAELGRYYLELHGWYGDRDMKYDANRSMIAFDWYEIAAHNYVDSPRCMAVPYLIMAVVMRENGRPDRGVEILRRGQDNIDVFPADERAKADAKKYLQRFIDAWNDDHLPHDGSICFLLGDPVLSKHSP